MDDLRANYFKARDIISQELKQKYNLIETYKDNNRLTLDNNIYSFHLTLYTPDGENISISRRGEEPAYGKSFMHFVCLKYPDREDMIDFLKKLSSDTSDYLPSIEYKLHKKTTFLTKEFPQYFEASKI